MWEDPSARSKETSKARTNKWRARSRRTTCSRTGACSRCLPELPMFLFQKKLPTRLQLWFDSLLQNSDGESNSDQRPVDADDLHHGRQLSQHVPELGGPGRLLSSGQPQNIRSHSWASIIGTVGTHVVVQERLQPGFDDVRPRMACTVRRPSLYLRSLQSATSGSSVRHGRGRQSQTRGVRQRGVRAAKSKHPLNEEKNSESSFGRCRRGTDLRLMVEYAP